MIQRYMSWFLDADAVVFVRITMRHLLFFFFSSRRRHTRCYRDWSSDVCSSDLTTKTCRDGQTLFSVGDRDFKFFIVKSGEVEIVDHSGDQPKTVTVHRKGQFTGDVSHLTGNPAVVSAVARGDTEVYEASGDLLRRILNQCPTEGDIILQAFIARRQLLRASADFTGLRVIGSRYSP